mmetsp:Transcript_42271/g.165062  ORF Transcript_42271/g.165062 Transcript_42271/m.165062 type:complete len:120 (+) Transcript_42271:130-489(+)
MSGIEAEGVLGRGGEAANNKAKASEGDGGEPRSLEGPDPKDTISYSAVRVIGNGSFGVVFQATVGETGETVAIKKVLQDKRFKNRELQIMRTLEHTNVVQLKHCFYSSGEKVSTAFRTV